MTDELKPGIYEKIAQWCDGNEAFYAGQGDSVCRIYALAARCIRACIEGAKMDNWETIKVGEYDEYDDMMSDGYCKFKSEDENGFDFFRAALSNPDTNRVRVEPDTRTEGGQE